MADSDADTQDAAPGATGEPSPDLRGPGGDSASRSGASSRLSGEWSVPECGKCGALLPDGEEGICPMCGTPFGFATGEVAAVPADVLAQHGFTSQVTDIRSANRQALEARAAKRAKRTAGLVLALVAILAAVLAAVVLLSR